MGDIEHGDRRDRKAREDGVAELAAAMATGDGEGEMEIELVTELAERIVAVGFEGAQHLLQGDHVGVEFRDDIARSRDIGLGSPVVALPAMNVVGRDAYGIGHDDRGYRPSGAHDEAPVRDGVGSARGDDPLAGLAPEIADAGDGMFVGATSDVASRRGRLGRAVAGPDGLIADPLCRLAAGESGATRAG